MGYTKEEVLKGKQDILNYMQMMINRRYSAVQVFQFTLDEYNNNNQSKVSEGVLKGRKMVLDEVNYEKGLGYNPTQAILRVLGRYR